MKISRISIFAILITLSFALSLSAQDLVISSISTTDVSCGEGSDGSITVTVSGGIGPYSYLLTKGAVPVEGAENVATQTFTFTNHDRYANYWVLVSDSNSPKGSDLGFATIDGPNPISITSFAGTNITCNNANDGSITVSATGEGGNYIFTLSGPVNEANGTGYFDELPEGIYTVSVSDGDGCPSTDESSALTIVNPDPISISVDQVTDVLCFGDYTGSISITPSGGVPFGLGSGYTYEWTGPNSFTSSLEDLSNSQAGDYFINVYDGNLCLGSAGPITINESSDLFAVLNNATDVTCNGGNNGTASITTSGGAGGYTYSWEGQVNGQISIDKDPVNLPADVYNLTVYDANGCSKTFFSFATIGEPPPFSIAIEGISDVSCSKGSDGSAIITPAGGTPGYTFLWTGVVSGYSSTDEDPSNMPADSYDLTLTDSRGCSQLFTAILVISEPTPLTLILNATNDVSCFGGNDGTASITVGGGTPPYLFDWVGKGSGFSSSMEDPDDLVADTYNLNITDSNACLTAFTDLVTIDEPVELTVTVDLVVDVNCQGAASGSIEITPLGGTPDYSYAWSGPNGFTSSLQDLSNLSSGDYSLTIRDAQGCTKFYPGLARVDENTAMVAVFSPTNVTCKGGSNGAITTVISGGTAPYAFLWQGPGGLPYLSKDISGLVAGSYQLTVTDALGCVQLMPPVVLSEPPAITATTTRVDVDCFGAATGSINLSPATGIPPYTFLWTGPNGFTATTEDISGLEAGLYSVSITDANSCSVFLAGIETILEPEEIQVAQETVSGENLCFGEANVQISIDLVTGGVPPYVYSINGGADFYPTNIFSNLPAGSYQTVVMDATGCIMPGKLNFITQPDKLEISSYSQLDIASCFDALEGQISIRGTGGTGNITYILNGSNTSLTGDFTNLPGGPYTLTLRDENGCTLDTAVVILAPTQISIDNLIISDVTGCFGDATGALTVNGSGGSGAISYSLNGGALQSGGTFSSLTAGLYTITLKDDSNCTRDTVVSILQPAVLSIGSGQLTPITCAGAGNGMIQILGAGGTTPLTYTLNPGAIVNNTGTFSGLSPNTYTVSVGDSESCPGVDTILTLMEPPPLVPGTPGVLDISCYGADDGQISIGVSGGVPPYLFSVDNQLNWSSDSIFSGLLPGTYEVYVRDANLCTMYAGSVPMTEPPQLILSVLVTDIASCSGDTTGVIEAQGSGGIRKLEYSLDGLSYDTSGIYANLPAALYTVYLQDETGCSISTPASINEPEPLTAVITKTDATYGNLGTITIGGSAGGTPPYEYTLGGPTGSFTGDTLYADLTAGIYHVIMRDLNGCTYEEMVSISDVPPLAVLINVGQVSCFGDTDGFIEFIPQNAEGTVSYSIDSGMNFVNTPLFEDLAAQVYKLVAIDEAGKVYVGEVTLLEPSQLILSPNITQAECNAFSNTGSINVTVTGGNGPYSYLWSDGSTQEDRTQLGAGMYVVTTTDANNCSRIDTIPLSSQVTVYVYAGADTTLCYGESLQLMAWGGHTATWDPSPFISDPNEPDPLTRGITENTSFVLTITEETSIFGCYNKDSIEVSLFPQIGIAVTQDTFVIIGASVPLEAFGGPFFDYRWEPEAGLSSAVIPNPIATPIESTRYYVYGTNESGCEEVDSVFMEVIENLRAYNAFSPNGDGINDYFEIENAERFPEMLVEVYSRWGSLLYSTVGYDSGNKWDGTTRWKRGTCGNLLLYNYSIQWSQTHYRECNNNQVA